MQHRPKSQTRALITDVGNDIVYDVPVKTIIRWVGECLDRLQRMDAQVVLTDLPIGTIRRLGYAKYRLLRAILFPYCRLSLEQIQQRAEQLSSALNEFAEDRKVPIYKPKDEWYGFDPIHMRRRFSSEFLSRVLRSWNANTEFHSSKERVGFYAMYLRCLNPEAWSIFGIERRARQPMGRLQNGTTIALF